MMSQEAAIRKPKNCVIAALLIATAGFIEADCWRWVQNRVQSDVYTAHSGFYLTFDESVNQPALLAVSYAPPYFSFRLWHYDGVIWQTAHPGYIASQINSYYAGIAGFYFDRNRNSLVIIETIRHGEWDYATAAFEINEESLNYIGEFNHCSSEGGVAYDTERNRAVICGTSYIADSGWLEFDGFQFYGFSHHDPSRLLRGATAYDPNTKKVIFWGWHIANDSQATGTYEYDGHYWKEIKPVHPLPVEFDSDGSEMVYFPPAEGMMLLPTNDLREMWIYKANNWSPFIADVLFDPRLYFPTISYNPNNSELLLFDPSHYPPTLEMKLSEHCRPVTKP